ncbi:hypothetical protein VTK73DRAFT_1201 [Phialemonium thermophilum]|uniref:Zn(2)-C6 fungal-type domain-containing protein n=1 Tax=Phialemonium thermophilum TaxID=223376 RepID=A0ABR3XBR4_9PEZI
MPPYHLPPPPAGPSGGVVTLPSIQDAPLPYGHPRGYPPPASDPRAAGQYSGSPTGANGYPAPGPPPPHQAPAYQYGADQRGYAPDYYPLPGRGAPYHSSADPYMHYGAYRQPPPPNYGAYPAEYARVGAHPPQPQQQAPRQRTSIACRYCRKRKIRCSGYQNTNNGKCLNCDKLRIDCVFQPVSSNSSTAFIPVTAVPGGVPPGTPLYGAYGQPLAPASGPSVPGQFVAAGPDYQHPLQSPASQYPAGVDERVELGRRRPRGPDDEPPLRLPPPNRYSPEENAQRRSPASNQGTVTPPTGYYQYPPGTSVQDIDRTSTPRSNTSTQPPSQPAPTSTNIMSLGNLVDQGPPPQRPTDASNDIDQSMLGKLNRRT